MKKILLFLSGLFLIITSFTPGQNYFEGVIIYEHKYESNNPNIDVADLAIKYGTRSEFYFKNGNYKQIFNGTLLKLNLFVNKDNKVYMHNSTSDTLFFIDCSQPNETIVTSEILKNRDTILERNCNLLSVKANNLSGKFYRNAFYYFDGNLKINPDWFKNVKYASYDKIYALTNSLPLKVVNDRGAFTITMTAVSVSKQKVDNDFFQLSKGVTTAPQKQ